MNDQHTNIKKYAFCDGNIQLNTNTLFRVNHFFKTEKAKKIVCIINTN